MKKYIILLALLFVSLSLYAENTASLGLVYSLGIYSAEMSAGTVIGEGEYVLTNKDSVCEVLGMKKSGKNSFPVEHINRHPIFVSCETGDIYECETVAVIDSCELALLKLPKKLTASNKIETKFSKFPMAKFEVHPKGKKNTSSYLGLNRTDDGKISVSRYEGKYTVYEKGAIDDKVYMCNIGDTVLMPGGMLIKDGKFYGILSGLVPLYIYEKKENQKYIGAQYSLGSFLLKYCEKNGIAFKNDAPSTDTEADSFAQMEQINSILGKMFFSDGESLLKAVDAYDKKDVSSYANVIKGIAYENCGKKDEAVKAYEASLKINPNEPLAEIRLANLKSDRLTKLQELLEKYPEDDRIYRRISLCYAEQENYDMASIYIDKAIKYSPKDPEYLMDIAQYQRKLKNYDNTFFYIKELNAINPGWEALLDFETSFFMENNNLKDAEATCGYWLKLAPKNLKANVYAGQICYMKGDKEQGDRFFETAKSLNPSKEYLDIIESVTSLYEKQ